MRRSKAEELTYLQKLLSASEREALLTPTSGETKLSLDDIQGDSVEERLCSLGAIVSKRLASIEVRAETNTNLGTSLRMPWMSNDAPSKVLEDMRRRKYLNDRYLQRLKEELMMHIALDIRIREIAKQAADQLHERLNDVPQTLRKLAENLNAKGLKGQAAQAVSSADQEDLVAFLNDRRGPEGEAALRRLLERATGAAVEFLEDEPAEEERLRMGIPDLENRVAEATKKEIELVFPDDLEALVDRKSGVVDEDYWSGLQTFSAPFEWQYRLANEDDEKERFVRVFPQPSWVDLAAAHRSLPEEFQTTLEKEPTSWKGMEDLLVIAMTEARLPFPERDCVKFAPHFAFLLHAHKLKESEFKTIGGIDRFDGLVFACPMNPHHVRVLRKKP